MGALLRALMRTGFKKGLAGPGGRGWLALGLAAGTIHFLRRHAGEPKVALSETLKPGQTMVITHYRKGEGKLGA